MNGIKAIYYRELLILKSRLIKTLLSSAISPLLFLIAFGFGIGKAAEINGYNYLSFLIPGLLAMGTLNQTYSISTEINISRFYFKTFDEYLLAPINRWEILIGESLYGITKGVLTTIIILIMAFIVNVNILINPLFIFILLIHLFTFSILGFIAALIIKNHGDQFAINTFIITPMIFLSGPFYPVDKMPELIKYIVHIFPLTYTTALLRTSMLDGKLYSIYYLLASIIIIIILAFISLFVINRIES
ncbi:MAG: ABC transporter permease [Deferribacterota bacterium]|nr:ABC transporter permease [Deferribacterota bacterium]